MTGEKMTAGQWRNAGYHMVWDILKQEPHCL